MRKGETDPPTRGACKHRFQTGSPVSRVKIQGWRERPHGVPAPRPLAPRPGRAPRPLRVAIAERLMELAGRPRAGSHGKRSAARGGRTRAAEGRGAGPCRASSSKVSRSCSHSSSRFLWGWRPPACRLPAEGGGETRVPAGPRTRDPRGRRAGRRARPGSHLGAARGRCCGRGAARPGPDGSGAPARQDPDARPFPPSVRPRAPGSPVRPGPPATYPRSR
jgi:hypothetical protein